MGVILAGALVLGGMAYCLDQPAARDASAVIACRDFLRLRADISKGIVSDAEMRPRVVAIYDSARLATTSAIVCAGTGLLAALTAHDAHATEVETAGFLSARGSLP